MNLMFPSIFFRAIKSSSSSSGVGFFRSDKSVSKDAKRVREADKA